MEDDTSARFGRLEEAVSSPLEALEGAVSRRPADRPKPALGTPPDRRYYRPQVTHPLAYPSTLVTPPGVQEPWP
uniref:Uncharacterized protein n=1 Tax=Peronospora matthiolae TaxID=2874970 RepID=A0AAV1U793_9STRA